MHLPGVWPGVRLAATMALCLVTGCAGGAAQGPWVRRIEIAGNRRLDDDAIRGRIALEESPWLPLAPRKHLDPVTLEIDRKRIEALYAAHGFFGARVTAVEVVPRGRGAVDVRIAVDEGPPTRVTRVDLAGLDGLSAEMRRRVVEGLPLRAGQTFEHARYLAAKGLLAARLRAEGHAWAEARGAARVDRARRTAAIEIAVVPGPRVRFGRIRVDGPPGVDRRAVARRAAFRPGEPFDPARLEATRGAVYETGVFSLVRVDPVRDPNRPDVAGVVITVQPAPRNELRLGGGFGLEPDRQELHLRARYVRRGFLGGLRTLRLQISPAFVAFPNLLSPARRGPAIEAEAVLTQPDLWIRGLSLRALAGYDVGIDYGFRFHGPRGSVGLGYPLARGRLLVGVSYNLQRLDFFDTVPGVFDDPVLSRRFFGFTDPYRLAYLAQELVADLRDRPLAPRRGAYFALALEEGARFLGGGFTYQRIVPDARVYLPLGPRVVLAGRLQYGRVFGEDDTATPITRRLYAGGPDSHRGFTFNRLAPQVEAGAGLRAVPVGGSQLLLLQAEARIELFRVRGSMLGLGLFVDAGDVPERGRGIDLGRLHVAVGGGLRYRTVIGTLRADVGVRLNRLAPFEPDGRQNPDPGSRWAFHLGIGEVF